MHISDDLSWTSHHQFHPGTGPTACSPALNKALRAEDNIYVALALNFRSPTERVWLITSWSKKTDPVHICEDSNAQGRTEVPLMDNTWINISAMFIQILLRNTRRCCFSNLIYLSNIPNIN